MHLIALLIGLVIERFATRFFSWRRMRWIESAIDAAKIPTIELELESGEEED